MYACAVPILVPALRTGQNVQSAALECPRWYTGCAGGGDGLLLPHQGHQRHRPDGAGDQRSQFVSDLGTPGAVQGTPARRH
eukprot:11044853-Alexandrium_andersonii.AAC.1